MPIKDMDIAFGLHPVGRFKAQAREAGAAALMPKRLGPGMSRRMLNLG